jgi:NitT/TauT family transport system substrate-binding protein
MLFRRLFRWILPVLGLLAHLGAGGLNAHAQEKVLRFGHFPNITHAQALVAHHLSRQGKGWFEERMGPGWRIEWFIYNAGPTAMEALLSGSLDATYVGPNPAINAHVRTKGAEVRVIAGATLGGSSLVVRADDSITTISHFKGKKIATPQFGNTQDVSCRAWLGENGFRVTRTGGDVSVIPTANPDQISLFQRKQIDAVWTVEPWVSRLEREANGRIFLDEPESITTVLVCGAKFLKENRDLAKKIAQAHAELTQWINENPEEARRMVVAELSELTKRPFPPELAEHAWPRMTFTNAVAREPFEAFLRAAQKVGFLREAGDLAKLVEIP